MAAPTKADLHAIEAEHRRLHGMVQINKYALDDELATQAVKFRDVTDTLAMCMSYMAAAKDEFDQVEASLIDATRSEHEREHEGKDKMPRLTDQAVLAIVKQDRNWQAAKALRRDWEHMYDKMVFLKDTFSQRSSNMKELPVLYAAGYWQTDSSTGAPRGRGERSHEMVRDDLDRRRALRDEAPAQPAPDQGGRRRPRG